MKTIKRLRITTTQAGLGQMLGVPCIGQEDVVAQGGEPTRITGAEHISRHQAHLHASMAGITPSLRPLFIDGDARQFELPVAEQDILLILPGGVTHQMKSLPDPNDDSCYELMLKSLEDAAPAGK